MIHWLNVINLSIICFFVEFLIYVSTLLIKALKIYIRKNSSNGSVKTINETVKKSKVGAIGVIIFNIILVVFLIAISYIQRSNEIYNTENVITCYHEMDEFTELLDDNKIEYKMIEKTKVKLQNVQDFVEAERIAQENSISYSTINIKH